MLLPRMASPDAAVTVILRIVLSLCCYLSLYLFSEQDLQILVKNGFNIMIKSDVVRIVKPEESNATALHAMVNRIG